MPRWTAIRLAQQKILFHSLSVIHTFLAGLYYFTNTNDKLHNHNNVLLYQEKIISCNHIKN